MDDDYGAEPVRYLDVYPKLPTNTPIGHPHIIDLECLDHDLPGTQSITIADLVVTVLFKFTPGTLTSFLDLERPKFLYMEAGGPGRLEFCIKRDGRMVIVGFLNEKEFGGWDHAHKYSIDKESTEPWTPVWSGGSGFKKETDAKTVLEEAPSFAYSIFMQEVWHEDFEAEVVCGLSEGRSF